MQPPGARCRKHGSDGTRKARCAVEDDPDEDWVRKRAEEQPKWRTPVATLFRLATAARCGVAAGSGSYRSPISF